MLRQSVKDLGVIRLPVKGPRETKQQEIAPRLNAARPRWIGGMPLEIKQRAKQLRPNAAKLPRKKPAQSKSSADGKNRCASRGNYVSKPPEISLLVSVNKEKEP